MKDGICISCKADKVYAAVNGFTHGKGFQVNAGSKSVWEFSKTQTTDFICVNCGYFESYISDKNKLLEVAQNWDKVGIID